MINIELLNCNNILVESVVESTNTWAHQLIQNGTARHAMVLVAQHQTAGKGQRNKVWVDAQGQTLMTSIILEHRHLELENQFLLNMTVAVALQKTLTYYIPHKAISIKWSNDIFVQNKKIAGVLIENIIRGNQWTHSILGIGININTAVFGKDLPHATSVFIENNKTEDLNLVLIKLIENLNNCLQDVNKNEELILQQYNDLLFGKNEERTFVIGDKEIKGSIKNVSKNGYLQVKIAGEIKSFTYGEVGFVL